MNLKLSKILIDVLQILVFVHKNNVIHRDIKPSNLIRRKSDGKIVLVDFGAVKQISTQVLNSKGHAPQTIAIGTQGYMPPEQVNGRPQPNSDLYALGRSAIQALTGLPSILDTDPKTGEIMWRQHSQVSNKLANILDKMVLSDWRGRYQSAKEVLIDLDRITGIKQPLDVGRYIRNLPKRRIWILGGIGGVILVAGIILFPLAQVIFLFNQANRLVQREQYREAIAIYDKVLEQYPDAVKAWINRGFALSKLNRTEEQLTSCNQALEIEPDLVEALNCRGLALQDLKRYEEAIFAYNNLVEIEPDFYSAWNNKGESLLYLERFEEALTAFDKAILYQPDYFFAWNNRGNVLFRMQRYPEAIAAYDKAIKINPNYHYAWNGRANTHKSLKRYQAAISDYNQAITIKPNFYEAWYSKGLVFFGLQQYQDAIISFDQAIKIKPDYRAAIEKREESLRKLGR